MKSPLRLCLTACLLAIPAGPAAAQRLLAPVPASQVHEDLTTVTGEPPTTLGPPRILPPVGEVAPEAHATPAALAQGPPAEWIPPFDDPGVPPLQRFVDSCHAYGRWFLFPQKYGVRVEGWVDGGYIGDPDGHPASRFLGPFNTVNRSELNFNQGYLLIEKPLSCDHWLGGRADVLYGNDFFLAQSRGFELRQDGSPHWDHERLYGVAAPQLYGEVGWPELSAKFGRFYSPVGYETVPSVNNFFFSHAYSYQFGTPHTHWGGLATWNVNDNCRFQAGVVDGWDTLNRRQDNPSLVGSASCFTRDQRFCATLAGTFGQEPVQDNANQDNNRTRVSLVLDAKWTTCLEHAVVCNFGHQEDGSSVHHSAYWYGVSSYVYYALTPHWKIGTRLEWFRDEEGVAVRGFQGGNPNVGPFPGNFYEATLGLNWTPCRNLILRPEIRYDHFHGRGAPFEDGLEHAELMLGLDVIFRF